MIRERKCGKVQAEDVWPRRALPCLGPDSMCPTPPRGSPTPKISRRRSSCVAVVTSNICRVRSAASRAFAIGPVLACSMTWATWLRASPAILNCVYSQHRCTKCNKFFDADTSEYSLPKARYTHRVVSLAVRLVVEDGLPYQAASWHLWRDHRVFVPFATIQNWVEAGGEKGGAADVDELSRLGPGGLLGLHRGR